MSVLLQIFLILFSVALLIAIIYNIRKKNISLNYSLTWLTTVTVMLILLIFPSLTEQFGLLLGIDSLTDTAVILLVLFLLIMVFTLTVYISRLMQYIYRLTQNQALMEKRIRELEDKNQDQKRV